MEERQKALRPLVTKFQETKDAAIFNGILARVDNLILYTIHKYVRCRRYLWHVNKQELYHAAIIGVYRAVLTARDCEDGGKITARIIAYIKSNIRLHFGYYQKEYEWISMDTKFAKYMIESRLIQSDEDVYKKLESEFINEKFNKLIADGILTAIEYTALYSRFAEHKNYKDVGAILSCSGVTACKRIHAILSRIRSLVPITEFE